MTESFNTNASDWNNHRSAFPKVREEHTISHDVRVFMVREPPLHMTLKSNLEELESIPFSKPNKSSAHTWTSLDDGKRDNINRPGSVGLFFIYGFRCISLSSHVNKRTGLGRHTQKINRVLWEGGDSLYLPGSS